MYDKIEGQTTCLKFCRSKYSYKTSFKPHYGKTVIKLTHWGRVTHKCVGKLTIIGSDNGLSPGRRQANIWTNAGVLLIRILGTNFSEIQGEIHSFSFSKMHLKTSSAKWRPFCLGLNVLMDGFHGTYLHTRVDINVINIQNCIMSYFP